MSFTVCSILFFKLIFLYPQLEKLNSLLSSFFLLFFLIVFSGSMRFVLFVIWFCIFSFNIHQQLFLSLWSFWIPFVCFYKFSPLSFGKNFGTSFFTRQIVNFTTWSQCLKGKKKLFRASFSYSCTDCPCYYQFCISQFLTWRINFFPIRLCVILRGLVSLDKF